MSILALGSVARDALGIAVTLAPFALLFILSTFYRRTTDAPPDIVRKLLHVGTGCIILTFPWLFERGRPWPVLAMGAMFVVLFLIRRRASANGGPGLGRGFGELLDGVG